MVGVVYFLQILRFAAHNQKILLCLAGFLLPVVQDIVNEKGGGGMCDNHYAGVAFLPR